MTFSVSAQCTLGFEERQEVCQHRFSPAQHSSPVEVIVMGRPRACLWTRGQKAEFWSNWKCSCSWPLFPWTLLTERICYVEISSGEKLARACSPRQGPHNRLKDDPTRVHPDKPESEHELFIEAWRPQSSHSTESSHASMDSDIMSCMALPTHFPSTLYIFCPWVHKASSIIAYSYHRR